MKQMVQGTINLTRTLSTFARQRHQSIAAFWPRDLDLAEN